MKNFLKRHKEIIFLIGVAFGAGFAFHDLFNDQQQNSGLTNSGTILTPSSFSGRVTCEVPIPSVESRTVPEGMSTLQGSFKEKKPVKPDSTNK